MKINLVNVQKMKKFAINHLITLTLFEKGKLVSF